MIKAGRLRVRDAIKIRIPFQTGILIFMAGKTRRMRRFAACLRKEDKIEWE